MKSFQVFVLSFSLCTNVFSKTLVTNNGAYLYAKGRGFVTAKTNSLQKNLVISIDAIDNVRTTVEAKNLTVNTDINALGNVIELTQNNRINNTSNIGLHFIGTIITKAQTSTLLLHTYYINIS